MTIHAPLEQDRLAQGKVIRAAHIKRMAKLAAYWATRPESDFAELEFLDALGFCIDADLSADMEACRFELGIDEEGYPLDCDGERMFGAYRRYIPLKRECV